MTGNVKQMLGVSIGDSIAVESPDGNKLIFTISGFLKNSAYIMSGDFYGIFLKTEDYCAIYPNVVDGEPADYGIMFFAQFTNTRNIQGKIANLKEQCNLSDEQVSSNNNLLGLLGQSRIPFLMQVYVAAAVLFVLVLLAGIMMITSSLNSNVAQRTEFFGLLRCIGATPKQVMRLVRKEALRWCRLAIPIGIFSGVVVIWVLCAALRFLSPEYFKAMPTFGLSIPSIFAGIVVGLLTVLLAAYSPAKKAAKVSPLAAVSGNANTSRPARNAANTKLFKIDTALGIHHAKASRKNLILMTSSFALSIILFLSFSVTVEFMQHTLTPLHPWTADLSIISPDNSCSIDKTFLDDLKENPVVDSAYGRMFAYEVPSVTNGIEKRVDLISYEQRQFDWAKDYLLEGSLESVQNEVGTGLIVYKPQNTIQIGDTVTLNISGQMKEIQIVGMLSDCPFYSAANVGTIICSENTFKRITGESKYTIIDVQLAKGATDEDVYAIHQMVDSTFTFSDERMGNSSTMGTYYCFWLFVYGFLVLIALITVFNIVNSIAMSVSSRLKQYGVFRAIGLSTGQLRKMIVAEAFTYTIIGGIVGTVLGMFSNKVLFKMLISYKWGDTWTIPLTELGIILLIVVLSALLAVYGPIKRIHNMSIVDTISTQ
ncbi:MAG: FtsX-like permease family protein [Anaeroplasmataceae bacterium]|nr:FtsX-like permease family protein [Anaeroplasmataceae bacterium]